MFKKSIIVELKVIFIEDRDLEKEKLTNKVEDIKSFTALLLLISRPVANIFSLYQIVKNSEIKK